MAASAALACRQQQRATFTVRSTGSAFTVVREMSGHDVQRVEEVSDYGPFPTASAANAFAYRAAESFLQQHPTFVAEARPINAGRNTGTPEVVSAHA
ncbi:hypothetical protein [Methylobacterium sp. Leaf118]|uniref:hypothetical protein n=1 Tax=Methylobacterium sp. Leaf118 TaxID=2876562 RepID=UPI001E4BBA80|nr:hypothetical protein [Methylobacterium sp. Leaf118]